ncbi:MAG: hypothetical protein GC178_07710 [Flavobacteriales bacterium]|nr:hypothetical protein [Flavobacteriales bacterium]
MQTLRIAIIILLCSVSMLSLAQDKLLLNNGRIKDLKATVVYYDNGNILFQNQRQKAKLEKFERKEEAKQKRIESSEKWKRKQEKKAAKLAKKRERQLAKLEKKKAQFEYEVKRKMETLSPADYEKWKNRELVKLKQLETDQELKASLEEKLEEAKAARKEALKRGKFASDISRQRVFSILHADGSEEIVYNADTLGILADGEPEVEYGVEEMRMYIKGRQDGRKHSFHDVYIGAGVGLISSLALTWTWDIFYAPIPPAICVAVIAGLRKFKPSRKLDISPEFLASDAYMDGYIRSARGRKALAFTIGAVGGLAVGSTIAVLTSPMLQKTQ